MKEKKLNLDFPSKITELEAMMTRLGLKKIIYYYIFRGKGFEFDGYRDYAPDDDAGMIDWMASVRGQKTLVRKYIEERDLKMMFMIDVSDSMIFGSAEKLKCEYAAEIAAALSHLIIKSGDKVGFGFFSEKKKVVLLPTGGSKRFETFAYEMSNPETYGGKPQNLDETFDFLTTYLPETVNAVFILSDFLNLGENFRKNFEIFSSKIETIPIIIRDELDETLPDMQSEIILESPTTGEQIIVNSSIAKIAYEKKAKEDKEKLMKIITDTGITPLELKTKENFVEKLVEFLNERARRKIIVMPK
jgi:hypothetical protein